VTAAPAAGALIYATNRIAHGKPANASTFFEGFRLYFWRSWGWGALNIVVVTILVSNYIFYGQFDETVMVWARALVITVSFLWLSLQMYTFPLMFEQEKPHLRTALRNSLVLLLKRPFYTMGMALLVAVIILVSSLLILPLWGFVSASACAYLANRTTVSSLARIAPKPDPSESTDEVESEFKV
jgi:uncharacterized membrane protein YesL